MTDHPTTTSETALASARRTLQIESQGILDLSARLDDSFEMCIRDRQAAVLQRLAVHRAETAFQVEHGAQAVTQVFRATQAEARAAAHALHGADAALRLAPELHLLVADTGVDQAVQRHGISGMRGTGETGQQRDCQ